MSPLEITVPVMEWMLEAPLIVLLVGATLGVLLEAVVPREYRYPAQTGLAILTVLAAMGFTAYNWVGGDFKIVAPGSIAVDGPTYFFWSLLLLVGLGGVALFAERAVAGGVSAFAASAATVPGSPLEREAERQHREHTEIFPLILFALFGMLLFAAANDLLTLFVALEIFSLPLYLLSGMARRRRWLSQEAALKYFLLGAFSSAFFLFGVALLYGYAGTFSYAGVAQAIVTDESPPVLLLAGLVMLAVGLLFKVGAVPFHTWTPDVYTGAPTPVTGFMAIATKTAAVAALLRVFYVALGGARWDWQPIIATVAVATMVVGAVVGLVQQDIKRLLAYSSIAHAGFIRRRGCHGQGRCLVGRVDFLLPAGLRLRDPRWVRDHHDGPARRGRGERDRRLAGAGPDQPVRCRGHDLVPAQFRRYPADRGFRRQIGGIRRRLAGRIRLVGAGRGDREPRGRLLLPEGRGGDVVQGTRTRPTGQGGRGLRVDLDRCRRVRCGDDRSRFGSG